MRSVARCMFRCAVRDPGVGADGKTVFYTVETETSLPAYRLAVRNGAGGRTFVVKRRFSDFEALHAHLANLAGAGLPPLPSKNVLLAAFGGDRVRRRAMPLRVQAWC